MRRLAFTSAIAVCSVALATAAFAQAPKSAPAAAKPAAAAAPAEPSPEILKARTRPPVKGTAFIEIIPSPAKLVKGDLVAVIRVKNTSAAPIAGLKIDQYFYHDKTEISAGTQMVRHPIAPGEIVDVTVSAPNKPGITGSQMMFSQANGVVKPTSVKKFTEDKK